MRAALSEVRSCAHLRNPSTGPAPVSRTCGAAGLGSRFLDRPHFVCGARNALVRDGRRFNLAKGAVAPLHDSEASARHLRLLRRVWERLGRAHAKLMAGGVAFFGVLAVFPGLFALLSLYGLLADLQHVQEHADALAGLLPRQVRAAIQTDLMEQVSQSRGVLGIELVGSVLLSSWSATNATEAVMAAITAVRGERESRSWFRLNLTAFLLTLAGVVFSAVSMAGAVCVSLGARSPRATERGRRNRELATMATARLGVAGGIGGSLSLRLASQGREMALDQRRSAIATVLWLSASAFFSWFVARHSSYTGLDGSIKTLTVLLAWFLMAGGIVIVGAAIDAEMGSGRRDSADHDDEEMLHSK